MRNPGILERTQRWWFFAGAALLVHGVLVVFALTREGSFARGRLRRGKS